MTCYRCTNVPYQVWLQMLSRPEGMFWTMPTQMDNICWPLSWNSLRLWPKIHIPNLFTVVETVGRGGGGGVMLFWREGCSARSTHQAWLPVAYHVQLMQDGPCEHGRGIDVVLHRQSGKWDRCTTLRSVPLWPTSIFPVVQVGLKYDHKRQWNSHKTGQASIIMIILQFIHERCTP